MLMAWVEEDELATLGCESPGQGDAVGPPGGLPTDPPQQ